MRTFTCVCGSRLFFENVSCLACGRDVGFDTAARLIVPVEPSAPEGVVVSRTVPRGRTYRHCVNRGTPVGCNWLVPSSWPAGSLCLSCSLTETTPDLSRPEAVRRWSVVEEAKRRLLFNLLELGLPVVDRRQDPERGLGFALLEDREANPEVMEEQVITGHSSGLVTVNLAEADDVERERIREALGERYRTVLGHLRHEAGHQFWRVLIDGGPHVEPFRALFGDERSDYHAAIAAHYSIAADLAWQVEFVSRYAQAHPLEDWAETFAHYLHMVDTIQTAESFGVVAAGTTSSGLDGWLPAWMELAVTLNSLNRSMGLRDPVPFVLTEPVLTKLRFIHSVVEQRRVAALADHGTSA